jgi:hypothetical protein
MTELKPDSQADHQILPALEVQPTQKKPRAARAAKTVTQPPDPIEVAIEVPAEPAEQSPKRKRSSTTTTAKRTTKPKSQPTNRAKPASTQVKLAWEVQSSTIASRFMQLEQELQQLKGKATEVDDQISSILSEMEDLRTIAREIETGSSRDDSTEKGLDLPAFGNPLPARPYGQQPATVVQTVARPVAKPVGQPVSAPIPPFSPRAIASSQPPRSHSRRPTLRTYMKIYSQHLHQVALRLPQKTLLQVADGILWVLAAAGLQYVLKLTVAGIPFLAAPVAALIFVPAIFAVYAAFFSPNADSMLLYRLLLVALGLFVGGKL